MKEQKATLAVKVNYDVVERVKYFCRERALKYGFYVEKKDARPPGCLKLTGDDGYRIRAGDYRTLCRIDDASKRIYIYRIKHRKNAYS